MALQPSGDLALSHGEALLRRWLSLIVRPKKQSPSPYPVKIAFPTLILLVSALLCIVACDKWAIDTHWKDGPFLLIAIDSEPQMSLVVRQPDDAALGLIGPTIFAVGSDSRYVVVKQHPGDGFTVNRSATKFFVIERLKTTDIATLQKSMLGPLDEPDYLAAASRLKLPAFTKEFKSLE